MSQQTGTITIDGADTFLGRAAAHFAHKSGAAVRGIVLSEDARVPEGVEKRVVSRADSASLKGALEGSTAVIMARKLIEEDADSGMTFDAIHRARTASLLEAAEGAGADRFIYVGLAGIERGGPVAMIEAEKKAEALLVTSKLKTLCLKTSLVVGPGDGHVSRLVAKIRHPGPFAAIVGQGWARSAPMSVSDFGRCIAALATTDSFPTGEAGLGGRERITAMEIFERLQIHLGRRKINMHVLESIAFLGARMAAAMMKKPPVSLARFSWLTEQRLPADNIARDLLGRFPRPFERAFGESVVQKAAEGAPAGA